MLRYERKYLVPNHLMGELRDRVRHFVRNDIYASANGNGVSQYTVRSIYFDSPDMMNYHEKHAGLKHRRKLRVRGYNQCNSNEKVVLEIKRKIENRIKKHRASVLFKNLPDLLESGEIEKFIVEDRSIDLNQSFEDARRFLFHFKLKPFQPTTLVTYEREAYHGILNPGNRITFDKNIRSQNYPDIHDLFAERDMRFLFKNHFIMEIKYFNDSMPGWAKSIVHEFKLRHEALSKYVIGFDVNKSFVHY